MKPVLEGICLYRPTTNLWVKVGSEIKEYIQPGANQEAELVAFWNAIQKGRFQNRPSNAIKVLEKWMITNYKNKP